MNELPDAHLIYSLSELAKLKVAVHASLLESAQGAIRTRKNILAHVGTLVNAARMTALGEQARLGALASTTLAESDQGL